MFLWSHSVGWDEGCWVYARFIILPQKASCIVMHTSTRGLVCIHPFPCPLCDIELTLVMCYGDWVMEVVIFDGWRTISLSLQHTQKYQAESRDHILLHTVITNVYIMSHLPFSVTIWWLDASSSSSPSHDMAPNGVRLFSSLDCFGF